MLYNRAAMGVMEKGLDMLWLKQKVVSNNLANSETPGYKTKSMSFQNVLSDAQSYRTQRQPDQQDLQAEQDLRKPANLRNPPELSLGDGMEFHIVENDASSIRPDGNNVDVEKESMELWRTYAQYSYLTQKISGQFKNMRYVINQALR